MDIRIILFITTIISAIVSLCGIAENNKTIKIIGYSSLVICIYSLILFIMTINTPSAMDVYKNKTTLKITYKDSMPIDSVVIYK